MAFFDLSFDSLLSRLSPCHISDSRLSVMPHFCSLPRSSFLGHLLILDSVQKSPFFNIRPDSFSIACPVLSFVSRSTFLSVRDRSKNTQPIHAASTSRDNALAYTPLKIRTYIYLSRSDSLCCWFVSEDETDCISDGRLE